MKKLVLLLTCLMLILGVGMACGALADEMPDSLEFPDIIYVTTGEPSEFAWSYGDAYPYGFLVGNGDDEEFYEDISDFFECNIQDGNLILTPLVDPGYYMWDFHVSDTDLRKDVLVRVDGANGEIPEAVIEMPDQEDVLMFLPGFNEKGYDVELCEGESCFIQPDNYLMLEMLYGDEPHWDFNVISGPEGLEIFEYHDDNQPYNFVIAVRDLLSGSIPSGSTAVVEGTLHWGDISKSCTFNFTFRDVELPDEISWETELHLSVGQEYTASVDLPDNNNWERERCLWYDLRDSQWRFKEDCIDPENTKLIGYHPGVYKAQTHIHASNLFIYGPEATIYVADENDSMPQFEDDSCYTYETTRAVFNDVDENNIYHNIWIRNYTISEEDFDMLRDTLGMEPEWSVEFIGDSHGAWLDPCFWDWEGDRAKRGYDVRIQDEPDHPCTLKYKVTCSWGEYGSINAIGIIHYVDNVEMPESLIIHDEIQNEIHGPWVNQPFEQRISWSPSTYFFGNDRDFHIDLDGDFDNNHRWEKRGNDYVLIIEPHEVGVFPVRISANWANIRIEKNVLLYVADENGEEPAFALRFEDDPREEFDVYDYHTARALFENNPDIGLYHDSWVRNYIIRDFDTLKGILEGDPVWNVEPYGEDTRDVEFHGSNWDWEGDWGKRAFDVNLGNEPTEPCTIQYRVTCSWGYAQPAVAICTIDYESPTNPLPQSLDIEDEIHGLRIHEEYPLVVNWSPENCGFGYGYDFRVNFDREFECENYWDWDEENGITYQYITPHESGIFPARLSVNWANIRLEKWIMLFVAEEGEEEDQPVLTFDDLDADNCVIQRAAFVDDEEHDIWHNGWVRGYALKNYAAMKTIYGGDAEWSVEWIGENHGAKVRGNIWDWDEENPCRGYDVVIENEPTEPCTLKYQVTCTMGSGENRGTITGTCTLNYVTPQNGLPMGIAIPAELHGKSVGEEYDFIVDALPEGYSFGENSHIDIDPHFDCGCHWDWVDGKRHQYLEPHEAGIYPVDIWLVLENISIHGQVMLYAANEGEEEDELELAFVDGENDERTFSTRFNEDEYGTVFSDNWCGDVEIKNFDALRTIYPGDPEWHVEVTGDNRRLVNLDVYDGGRGAGVHLDYLPWEEKDDVVIRVCCDWGGHEIFVTKTIDFVTSELPTGTTLEDYVIRLKPGQPNRISLDFDPDGYSFANTGDWNPCFWFHDDDMNQYMDIEVNREERWVEFTPHEGVEGIFNGAMYARSCNVCAGYRNVAFVISEDEAYTFEPVWDAMEKRVYAIGPLNDRIGVCIDPFLHYARMENFYAGEAFFGEPGEWSCAFVDGDFGTLHAETREPFEYLIWLEDEDVPQERDTATLRVTVSFGDVSFSHDCVISYDYYDLPEGGELPDELHLVAGKTQRVTGSFIPANYSIPGADNRAMYFECYADTGFEWEMVDGTDNTIDVTFYEVGVYPAHIQLEVGNVRYGKDILVFVGDGETEPEDVLQVQGGPWFEEVPILNQWWEGEFGGVDLHTEDIMADFWFEEGYYDGMCRRMGCEPYWSYHQQGGEDIRTELMCYEEDNDPRGAMLFIRNMPKAPEDVTFTVTCEWTEQYRFEKTFTIRFVEYDNFPDSLNIASDIYMYAGEPTEIEYSVTRDREGENEEWSYDPESRHFDFWPVGNGEEVEREIWIDEDNGKLYVRFEEPGVYVCAVFLRESSIVLPKRFVTFHVKDSVEEDSPNLEFRFRDEAMYMPENSFLIFDEQEDVGLIHDDFVCEFEIEDFYGQRTRKEGDPVWTLEQLDHEDEVGVRLWAQNYEWEGLFDEPRGFQVFASGLPETECDVHYQVTCEWDGESIATEGVIHYLSINEGDLPASADIPTVINLKLDEENSIPMAFLDGNGGEYLFPEDIETDGNPRINIDWHDDFEREDWCEGHTLVIRPYQEGAFHAWVGVTAYNLNFGKEVVFIVTGDGETEPLEVQGGPWFEEVAILNQFWEGDFGEVGLHTEDVMADYFFPETAYYARKAELGTEPEWHLTMQGAEDGEFELWLYEENNDPRGMSVMLRSMPEQPKDVTFTVTCDWDDFHFEDTFTISFVDDVDLPESLNIENVIETHVRRRTVVPYSVDPENWHCADDRHFEIRLAEGDNRDVDFHVEYDREKDELSVLIDRPGTYTTIVFLREGSITVPKRFVTFQVKDRGDKLNLKFEDNGMYDVHRTFAIFDEEEDRGLIHDDWVCNYRLDDSFDSIFLQKGTYPEWHVEQKDHQDEVTLNIRGFEWEGEHYSHSGIQLFAQGMPAEDCDVHYTVTCNWGGLSVKGDGIIQYVSIGDDEFPTGVNVPDVIELTLGRRNRIDLSFIPESFRFGEDDRINYEFYDEFDREDWEEEHSLFIVPHESGDFAGWVGVTSGNINFGKNVIFRVSDEGGNMPERVEPILWTHEVTYNIAIVPEEYDEQYGVRADNWIDDVGLKNHEAMLRTYGDNVTWTVEQTEGEDLQPWTEYREHGCAFFIDRQPTQTGTARFTITGDWGDGITTSIDYILNIIEPDALPTGVKLYHEGVEVDEITMMVGDTAYVTSEFEPDPDWRLPGREDREWLDTWLDDVDSGDNPYFNFDGDGYTAWFTAKQPGIYYMNTQARSGNVQAYRQLKVTVTETAPILENDFEMDIMLGELMGVNNTGWLIRPNFWSMEPLNLQALREVYGDDAAISWNVEIVDGADVGVGYETYEVDGIENAGATFSMTSLPSEPCQSVIRITTGWNGNDASLQGTLNFVPQPANVPTTNTLPDRLRIRVGETIDVYGYYPEGDWDVRQNFAWIGIEGVCVEEDYGDPHHLFLTGEQPGVWYGEALVGQQARGMTRKWITIVVYDDSEYTTMTLPAALTEIGEEAFEGIAADRVIIPDGCQRIEARAFVNCPNLREVHIPDSVWSIGDDAFDVRDDLVIITDNGVIQEWADNHHILWFNE